MRTCSTAVVVAAFLVIGHDALGQQEPGSPVRVWSVSVAAGAGIGLSTRGVEAAMKAGGFDDLEGCMFWCTSPKSTPYSDHGGRSMQLTVRRRLGGTTHVRAMVARTVLGETHGYKETAPGGFLFLKQSVITCAVLAGVGGRDDRGLYIASGPSVFRVALEHTEMPGGPTVAAIRLGAIAALGFVVPLDRRYFLDLQGRCCITGPVKMGPVDVPGSYGSSRGTLPRTGVNFTHGVLALGIARRF